MPDFLSRFVTAFSIVILLMLGVTIVDSLGQTTDGLPNSQDDLVLLESAGTYTSIDDAKGTGQKVKNSRGYAIRLTGASDSFVESQQSIEFATDQNWTVSVWGYVESESASDNMTAVSVDGQVVVWYNGTAGNWSAWYYDEGARDSYRVNVSVNGQQPGNFTNVIAIANGTHLTIYQNNTVGESTALSGGNTSPAPVSTSSWNGRLDEVRTFDDALNATQRANHVSNPIAPRTGTNRTARIMFDEPGKSTQIIFFTDSRLSQSKVDFKAGLPETVMVEGTDYEWDTDGPRIKPLAGGELDGAPAAYVSYDLEEAKHDLIRGFSESMSLAAIIPMLIVVTIIIAIVRE